MSVIRENIYILLFLLLSISVNSAPDLSRLDISKLAVDLSCLPGTDVFFPQEFDNDANGLLDVKELEKINVVMISRIDKNIDRMNKQAFMQLDLNKNGILDDNEKEIIKSNIISYKNRYCRMEEISKNGDINDDGWLSIYEKKLINDDNKKLGAEEYKLMIDSVAGKGSNQKQSLLIFNKKSDSSQNNLTNIETLQMMLTCRLNQASIIEFDTDNDFQLNDAEKKSAKDILIKRLNQVCKQYNNTRMAWFDTNKNKKIDPMEELNLVTKIKVQQKIIIRLRNMIKLYDKDKDYNLNSDELSVMLKTECKREIIGDTEFYDLDDLSVEELEDINATECRKRLKRIGGRCILHAEDHRKGGNYEYPLSLDISKSTMFKDINLFCPSAKNKEESYIYFGGVGPFEFKFLEGMSDKTVLAMDKLGNHKGYIHVLMTNGKVVIYKGGYMDLRAFLKDNNLKTLQDIVNGKN